MPLPLQVTRTLDVAELVGRRFDATMGMAKRYMAEVEARGWSDVGTTICSECVVDEALVAAIKHRGGTEPCDYCEQEPKAPTASAPIELVLELVVDGLRHEYEDPAEQMAWDEGYVGSVYDTWDLLYDLEVTDREDVHRDVHGAIGLGHWCDLDPYAASPTEALTWGWEAFRTFVKHSRRYTFLVTDDSTADGAGMIPMHAMPSAVAEAVNEGGRVTTLPASTTWWRLRPHHPSKDYSSAKDIGTPPDNDARDNRMTPKGIGAFYGASTLAGARAEVAGYADPSHAASYGQFTTTVPLTVVDLRELPAVPSLFDPLHRGERAHAQFLRGFVADVTKVADPSDKQDLDYVPTQVLAETFRYELEGSEGPVAGVLWRSSKDPAVTSCVLFLPSSEVADQGAESDETRLTLDATTVGRFDAPL
jgi:hypothetical protein